VIKYGRKTFDDGCHIFILVSEKRQLSFATMLVMSVTVPVITRNRVLLKLIYYPWHTLRAILLCNRMFNLGGNAIELFTKLWSGKVLSEAQKYKLGAQVVFENVYHHEGCVNT
jgi:hypothetical protein